MEWTTDLGISTLQVNKVINDNINMKEFTPTKNEEHTINLTVEDNTKAGYVQILDFDHTGELENIFFIIKKVGSNDVKITQVDIGASKYTFTKINLNTIHLYLLKFEYNIKTFEFKGNTSGTFTLKR